MRKKLICLLLCLSVLLPAMLAGCGEQTNASDGTEEESSARAATTLSMWVVSEKRVSLETEALIEEAVNEITQSKYTTKVDLSFFTEDEYYTALEEKLAAIKEYKDSAASTTPIVLPGATTEETEDTTAETIVNELGQRVLKYPDLDENQLDIIFLAGKDRLRSYADAGYLSVLDTNLNSTSKVLKDYIFPTFLDQVKYNKNTYAIPNNHLIGEYTYLLINKALAEKYYFDTSAITSLVECADLIEDIGRNETDVPAMLSYVDPVNMHYWLGDGEMSILVSYIATAATIGNRTIMRQAFETSSFTNHMLLMKKCEENGWFAENPETAEKFGVAVMKGDYNLREEYGEDYAVKVLSYPMAEEDTVYEAMFGVSSYTVSLDRSMEIITFLNTDPELKNILQYGVEGVHYSISDGELVYLNEDYRMNNLYTGNMFMSYPERGMDADIWETQKAANRDSKISPYFGLSDEWGKVDTLLLEQLAKISDEYMERMNQCATAEELSAFFQTAKTELAQNEMVKAAFSTDAESNSPYAVYSRWFEALWPSAE